MTERFQYVRMAIIDLVALAVVFFTPAFSHLMNFPLYLIEPMRIMVILALLHTNRTNALILAVSLPVFSFAVSAHPVLLKMLLISAELSINVLLFSYFIKMMKAFPAMALSVFVSKAIYYLLKYVVVMAGILQMSVISTSLWIQLLTGIIFSTYAWMVMKTRQA
ncbi:MAG: hypothetical protein Q7J34_11830 [Bacteroidales bacterium]|nr:hypothetical protein [Bacteroidales bacterium]